MQQVTTKTKELLINTEILMPLNFVQKQHKHTQ